MRTTITGALLCVTLGASMCAQTDNGFLQLPADLQAVSGQMLCLRELPGFHFRAGNQYPPFPFNWCAGRSDVLYFVSPSFTLDLNSMTRWPPPPSRPGESAPWTRAARRRSPHPGGGGSGGSSGGGTPQWNTAP